MGAFLAHLHKESKKVLMTRAPPSFQRIKKENELDRKKAQCQRSRNSQRKRRHIIQSLNSSGSGHPACLLGQRFCPKHRQEDPPLLPSVGKESARSQRKRRVFLSGRKPTILLIFAIFSAIFRVTKEGAFAGNLRKRCKISAIEGMRSSTSLIACK
jgi:hypothetical protein